MHTKLLGCTAKPAVARVVRLAGILAFLGTTAVFAEPGQVTEPQAIETARQYFSWLREGKNDACVAMSDETMQQALPADKLAATWGSVVAGFGTYEAELQVETNAIETFILVDLISKFKAANLAVRVTIDSKGKVAGLFFTPTSKGIAYSPPDYVDQTRFREEPVHVSAGSFSLPATLTIPVADGPHPAVVLVHGSGPHDEDETIFLRKPFRDLAWGLASRGIAVLRYQKRTQKYGAQMDPAAITIDSETVDDAIAAVGLLAARKEVRADRIFVVGHSLGATAAPYMASKEPRIYGLVMLGAAARPIYTLVEEQVAYLAGLDGTIDAEEQASLDEIRAVARKIREGTFTSADRLLGAPATYWSSLDAMDPVRYAKVFRGPMLIVQGGRDYQVSMADTKIWQTELAGRKTATIKVFAKMDHLLQEGEGPSDPAQYKQPGHVDARVIAYLADWIRASAAQSQSGV